MMAGKAWLFETDPNTPTLKAILASKKPMEQKALGRKVHGFNDDIWTPASVEIVVASQIARAEVDRRLGQLYISSSKKVFVEGSPRDKIWGVGIYWKQKSIENERNWKGENRLGKCHGLARDEYGKQEVLKRNRAEANEPKMESEDAERSKEESLGVAKNQEAAPVGRTRALSSKRAKAKSEDAECSREESDEIVVQDQAVASEQALQQVQA
jgi:ribA/ribD-fused uncharacterized protein